jgi:hypothetical protein
MLGCSWVCTCSAALVALALSACGTVVPRPTDDDGAWAARQWDGSSVATLSEGRDLYVAKCGGCHSLYAPTAVSASRWPATVDDMVENAGIRPNERDLIVHYLLTASRARTTAVASSAHR